MRLFNWMMSVFTWIAAAGLVLGPAMYAPVAAAQSNPVSAARDATCPDNNFGKQISNICWDCFFPFVIFSFPVGGSASKLPDGRAGPICVCPGRMGIPAIGFTLGWWAPTHIIENVRQPWCMPTLGGIVLTDDDMEMGDIDAGAASSGGSLASQVLPARWGGPEKATADKPSGVTYYNWHWIKFPVAYLIGWMSDFACSKRSSGAIDIAFMSEFDPSWNNDDMALWTSPETVLFTGPWAYMACAADGVAATVRKPVRQSWWCGGTWGQVYPFSGNVPAATSTPREASLNATKGLAKMHRFGLATKMYGNRSLCKNTRTFLLEKQQYKFQTMFPIAEKKNHWIGASTFRWGEWRTIPARGEDYVWLQWSYTECCVTLW